MPSVAAKLTSGWHVIECRGEGLAGTQISIARNHTGLVQICGVRVYGTQTAPEVAPGLGVGAEITLDGEGTPHVVNTKGKVFKYNGSATGSESDPKWIF